MTRTSLFFHDMAFPALLRKTSVRSVILLAAIVLFTCGSYFRILENNELDTLDMRFRLRPAIPVTDNLAIIEIGDDTIGQLGRFPFDRSYHAILVKALSEYGARAIVFDIFFSETSKDDPQLQAAIKAAGNVYLPYVFDIDDNKRQGIPEAKGYVARNLEGLSAAAKGEGHINVIPDPDGKYRRVPFFIKYRNAFYPYLSFRVISDYLGVPLNQIKFMPGRSIQCGQGISIPLDENSETIVNFAGPWGKRYKHYSFVDVLRTYKARLSGKQPDLDVNVFRNKICLVGLTATGTTDLHPNAFAALYPALGMHADTINAILNKRFITRASKALNSALLVLLLGVMAWAVFYTKPLYGLFVLVGLAIVYTAAAIALFFAWGLWVDMFYPAVALVVMYLLGMLMMYIREWKKRIMVESELQVARKIQQSFLPRSLPATKGLLLSVAMYTAHDVGGDLYDFCEFSPQVLGVMIGDVAGKGIPASLFMAMVSGAFKSFAVAQSTPAQTLLNLNEKLIRESSAHLFVTMFYAIFDTQKRIITYSNGGHLPVLHLSKNGPTQFLDTQEGYPLGVLAGPYSGNQINFSCGDVFVFYTDGITEAMSAKAQMYGKERLVSVVEKNRQAPARDLLSAIEKDVRHFEPAKLQHDDMTCIVIRVG